jgi:hypothetical protein
MPFFQSELRLPERFLHPRPPGRVWLGHCKYIINSAILMIAVLTFSSWMTAARHVRAKHGPSSAEKALMITGRLEVIIGFERR